LAARFSVDIFPIGKMKAIRTAAELGAAIRAARQRAGLTLAECAGANGVGIRFLSELERGKEGATIGRAFQVAQSLGIRIVVLDED
jgi:HTH-type transcriptional regulator / antitoxin HipB